MIAIPDLKTLKKTTAPKAKGEAKVYDGKIIPVESEYHSTFIGLKELQKEYLADEDQFHEAFARTIGETPRGLDSLVNEQIEKAKGFLNRWGAYAILFKTLHLTKKKLITDLKIVMSDKKELSPKELQEKMKAYRESQKTERIVLMNHVDDEKPALPKSLKKKAKTDFKVITEANGMPITEEDIENAYQQIQTQKKAEKELKQHLDHVAVSTKTPKKKKLKVKKAEEVPEAPPSKTEGHKRSIICILNGGEGSGKSLMAQTFPTGFTLDLEDKLFDLIDYHPDLDLTEGIIGDRILKPIGENRQILFASGLTPEDDYVVALAIDELGDRNYIETDKNIEAVVGWYMLEGYKYHQSFIIDVGKAIREASIRAEEIKKGRTLGQYEYIPITKELKTLLIPLIHFCRFHGRHLVIITHWSGIYEVRKNAQGFDVSVRIGREPDVKDWLRDLVTWRIDFLKPDESGFENKFIIDFTKAPGQQYFQLDITDKSLFEIISNPERLEEEKEIFRQLEMRRKLTEKEEK